MSLMWPISMIWEDLGDIVLVGHSYGGVVVRHVADRMRGPDSLLAHLPRRLRSRKRQSPFRLPARQRRGRPETGSGPWRWLESSAETSVVPRRPMRRTPACRWIVSARCIRCPDFEAPAQISGACDDIANIGYILASGFDGPFGAVLRQGRRAPLAAEAELACGHDVMLSTCRTRNSLGLAAAGIAYVGRLRYSPSPSHSLIDP